MNERIAQMLAQMAGLDDYLRSAVHGQESRLYFQMKGKRVEFEQTAKAAHQEL
ncbi:MAG TPA: hypothetical protein VET87_24480 [Rubrivivax sp.]|nr:hypothetical protein [Rubrivivax sp.]